MNKLDSQLNGSTMSFGSLPNFIDCLLSDYIRLRVLGKLLAAQLGFV